MTKIKILIKNIEDFLKNEKNYKDYCVCDKSDKCLICNALCNLGDALKDLKVLENIH